MVTQVDPRRADWLDLVGDLLRTPHNQLPLDDLAALLGQTFQASAVTWSESLQRARHRMWPDLMLELPIDRWYSDGTFDRHPLIRWYKRTLDPRAQTCSRVPPSIAPRRDVERWQDEMQPWGLIYELSLPLRVTPSEHDAFVVARGDEEFPEPDVVLARRLQPVLRGLRCQAAALSRLSPITADNPHRLSGRELAVLSLLADGLTAQAIGRRLAISPRTVEKHLEHIYAKLQVRDRVSAVRQALREGMLPRPDTSPAASLR